MNPLTLFAELLIVYTGWQLFPDGPLAFYTLMGVWVALLMFRLAFTLKGDWWPVCLFGVFLGLSQSVCGLAYVGDGRSFLCDKGTGLPITPLVMGAAIGILFYLTWRRHGSTTAKH